MYSIVSTVQAGVQCCALYIQVYNGDYCTYSCTEVCTVHVFSRLYSTCVKWCVLYSVHIWKQLCVLYKQVNSDVYCKHRSNTNLLYIQVYSGVNTLRQVEQEEGHRSPVRHTLTRGTNTFFLLDLHLIDKPVWYKMQFTFMENGQFLVSIN